MQSFQLLLLEIPSFISLEYWKGVLQNSIGCAIGSIIGIAISVGIYINSITKNEKIKETAKDEEETNHLKAFSFLLSKGIKVSKQQSENVKKFIDNLSKPFIEYPLMAYIPLTDLKRIIETITIEKTGSAYMNAFSSTPNSAKEFTEILSCVDYLYLEFGLLPDMLKTAILNDFERKKELQRIYEIASNELVSFILSMTIDHPLIPHMKDIDDSMAAFQNEKPSNYDLKYFYDNYFVPMNKIFITFIQAGHRIPFVISFAQQTQEGKEKYEHMLEENKRMLEDINGIYLSINTGIESLISNSNVILSSKYASLS